MSVARRSVNVPEVLARRIGRVGEERRKRAAYLLLVQQLEAVQQAVAASALHAATSARAHTGQTYASSM